MKRNDSVFALLLCLAIIYYAATGWGDQVIFPAGSGGTVRESGENEISAVPLGNGKKYSAEFMQEERAYTVTAIDTRKICQEENGEYGVFRVYVRDGEGNTVQEFICRIPVRHVVSLEFDDLDFDGFPDLKIGYSNWKNEMNYCFPYLWGEEKGKFGEKEIGIPMEYEKEEERKMFQAVFRRADKERKVICRIGRNRELDMLRYWEIDKAVHRQTIGDCEGDKIIYEGAWGGRCGRIF